MKYYYRILQTHHARTHALTQCWCSFHHSTSFMVDDVVSITPEIHLLSLTMFAQEALVTRNLYELKWYACANYLCEWRPASVASVADGIGGDAESCLLPALPAYIGRSRLEGRTTGGGGSPGLARARLGLGLGGVGTVASCRMLRIRCRAWLDRCRAWLDRCRADSFLLVWGGFAGAPTNHP